MADKLQDIVAEQKKVASNALLKLPEGETKNELKKLLVKASSGKVSLEDAQREIDKIVRNAS